MRVLMLGWDFSPRLSGGVGSACQGLAKALTRAPEPLRTGVLFVLPRVRGDEEPEAVRLLASESSDPGTPGSSLALGSPGSSPALGPPGSSLAPGLAGLQPGLSPTPPALPSPSESLRLLAIDSPLRPYLAPQDYAEVVGKLMARVRKAGLEPGVPTAALERGEPRARLEPGVPRARLEPGVPARLEPGVPGPVPPYGRTLLAEVERYARAALALVQRESFDLVHAHDWMTFPAGLLLKECTGKPLVVHFHSCEVERRGPLATADVRAVEQAALDAADRVLCVSEQSARTLRDHYAVERAKLRVLHNAFAPLEAAPPSAKDRGPVVLYLGRLSAQKGPDVFLRAAQRVHARLPRAGFVLAGEGELYPELRALAEELGLSGAVRFTGFVGREELARTYAGADVYVMPSRAEPFGIGTLEALSLGVPAIVARDAGVTEVVSSVLRFEPGNEAELADKIVSVLERPALRRSLVETGLREVRKLRWDRPARALRAVYEEIAVPAAAS